MDYDSIKRCSKIEKMSWSIKDKVEMKAFFKLRQEIAAMRRNIRVKKISEKGNKTCTNFKVKID